jgi:hypothetical protein
MSRADGHLVSFDIPRVALQKTKYVIDKGLGGLMWWAVDEDWVEPASAPAPAKRDSKTKRACKKRGDIGYVHAVEIGNTTSTGTSISDLASGSTISSSTAVQSSSASVTSASSTSSATSEAEGEKDGIQLNVGRSLVQVAKEGFEKYASGLDTTWNVLGYPSSRMPSAPSVNGSELMNRVWECEEWDVDGDRELEAVARLCIEYARVNLE